jgi:hypothetical protein
MSWQLPPRIGQAPTRQRLKLTKELLIVGGFAANSYMFLCSLAHALGSTRG